MNDGLRIPMEDRPRTSRLCEEPCSESYPEKMQEIPPQDYRARYPIEIQFMTRGCVIKIGCVTIPFSTTEEARDALIEFIDTPKESIKKWEKLLNRKF